MEQSSEFESSDSDEYINAITHQSKTRRLYSELIFEVNNTRKNVKCELDTGATTNVIGVENLRNILDNENIRLKSTKVRLGAFGGKIITPLGRYVMNCVCQGKIYKLVFQVVKFHQPPLLSNNTCTHLKMITRVN